jgi:hypothetical protein
MRARRQAQLPFYARGGKREGAGRPPNGDRAGMPHAKRPRLSKRHPVHVTLRVSREVGRLRRRDAYRCVSQALLASIWRRDFRVVHVSIQATHLHLRYHAEHITTPRQARNTFAYILNNRRKHRERGAARWRVDPYSSAVAFDGWKDATHFKWPRGYEALPVSFPTLWLLRIGWRRHGAIDLRERPGRRDPRGSP